MRFLVFLLIVMSLLLIPNVYSDCPFTCSTWCWDTDGDGIDDCCDTLSGCGPTYPCGSITCFGPNACGVGSCFSCFCPVATCDACGSCGDSRYRWCTGGSYGSGQCVQDCNGCKTQPVCGNGACQSGEGCWADETCSSCPNDCGPCCVANQGRLCNCGLCGCGGTILCDGSCSGPNPAPPNFGQTCGNCGIINCNGDCINQGSCSPGSTLSCGDCGTQTCSSSCTWGSCSGEGPCSPGQTDSQGCGNCGTQTRTCTSSCSWDAFGSCTGEGPCSPGDSYCSGNIKFTCSSSCQWQSEDCTTKASTDSDGSPTAYTLGGTVTDYLICSGGSCTSNSFLDSCSVTILTEYGASGASYVSGTKECQDYESNYCLGNRQYRREYGCSGTPGFCNDAAVPDTRNGIDADNDSVDIQCGDSLCDNNPNFIDSNRQCSPGQTRCNSSRYQTCNNCAWQNSGTDADNDSVDQQCEDATCDTTRGICDTSVAGKCIAKTPTETACRDNIDNDCDGFIDCQDSNCAGFISGKVTNQQNNPIFLADVSAYKASILNKSVKTDQQGDYGMDLCNGTYDLTASHASYFPSIKNNINVITNQTTTVNFTLQLGSSCEQDCTYIADNLVHASCRNYNGCTFYDDTAQEVCDLSQPTWTRDYNATHYVICAPGAPQPKTEIQASVTCSSGTLVKVTRIVVYNGKPVKLVVATCG